MILITEDINGHKINGLILAFLHLGYVHHLFQPFMKISGEHSSMLLPMNPTLSPKDPSFEAWWAEHKSEWENEVPTKPACQEPADD